MQSGIQDKDCKIRFENGDVVYGVLTNPFPSEPATLYLVKIQDEDVFEQLRGEKNYPLMKKYCTEINIDDVSTARPLDSFDLMLLKKQHQAEGKLGELESRKRQWKQSVETLFVSIRDWLEEYVDAKLLTIETVDSTLNEESIGVYTIPQLILRLGNETVTFAPKGTMIIGSFGRVDMEGPLGGVMLVELEWNQWKFARRTPRVQYWDVNEESMKSVIREIVNG